MIWKDTNRNELGYRVERKSTRGTEDWSAVTTLPAGSKVFVDKQLNASWEYDYRIVAINSMGETVSAAITVQTMSTPHAVGSALMHLNSMQWQTNSASRDSAPTSFDNNGTTLAIGGQGYFRGFTVNANSDLRFTLDGQYTTFLTDIGLDDSVADKGSVKFQVWADNEMLYESDTVKGAAKAQSLKIDVAGKKELWLVVTDAGDGTDFDVANWANPRLAA
jgi:hypothetical protein